MSWQAYVDSSLVGSGNIDKAAIFDDQGTSPWATSAGFQVNPEEMKFIVASFKPTKPGDIKEIQSKGFHLGGDKYVTLKSDDSRVYGKLGKTGVIIVKTKKALLIAHYPENVQPGAATNTVEALAEYLIGVGY
ncbi:profilin-A [Arthroderma uncinatum]|uniref:profilin-A n=1 Tax=Arthroderma uncinatum TaxID=74035 RepID=UPI00144A71CC|nr:profilin-A [Arthroderma uncinatum]KAF3480916.1 profilin-A [Arthroderma uncinatum]